MSLAAALMKRRPPLRYADPIRGVPTVDGGMRHLIYGGGVPHHAIRTGEIRYIRHPQATMSAPEPVSKARRPRYS